MRRRIVVLRDIPHIRVHHWLLRIIYDEDHPIMFVFEGEPWLVVRMASTLDRQPNTNTASVVLTFEKVTMEDLG